MKKIINKITENVKKNTIIGIIFFIWMTMAYVVGIKFLIKTSDVLEVSDRLMYLSAASIFSMSFLYLLKEYTTSFVDLQELSFGVRNLKFGWLNIKNLFLINAFLITIGLLVDVVALAILLNSAYIVLAGNLDKIINKNKINQKAFAAWDIIKPDVVIYMSGRGEVAYQLPPWMQVMNATGLRYAVIFRNEWIFHALKTNFRAPCFLANSGRAVEQLLTTHVKIVLYPNNREKNTNSLRFFELKHVFVNHGESDKSVNQSKMIRSYDHIFVSGVHARGRMESAGIRFLDDQIKVVGRPQIELNYAQSFKVANEKKNKLIIAYAPTWEGGSLRRLTVQSAILA